MVSGTVILKWIPGMSLFDSWYWVFLVKVLGFLMFMCFLGFVGLFKPSPATSVIGRGSLIGEGPGSVSSEIKERKMCILGSRLESIYTCWSRD
jgi:hypothetical protein